jgi:putative NIF3 family GTP cyclohydrolase 1 type 2
MSFHTRLDAVAGGVNDTLAAALGLRDTVPFGADGEWIGRVGNLGEPMTTDAFASLVCAVTGAPCVQVSDAGKPVFRVAVMGGSGSDDVGAALASGADTYLSGELKHNYLTDAPESGMNLLAAGHFYTENPVCETLREMVLAINPDLEVRVTDSNPVRTFSKETVLTEKEKKI